MNTAMTKFIPVILSLALFARTVTPATYEITRIGSFGGADTRATDINDHAHVVGYSFLPGETVSKAFVFDGMTMKPLDGLNPESTTFAYAINNHGDIVGHNVDQTTYHMTALLWTQSEIIDIGADLRADHSTARDINDHGMVVGQAAIGATFSNGFIWDGPGSGQIVGTLEGRHGGANYAVNDNGLVVGYSFFYGSPGQAHLVTSVDGHYESNMIGAPFPGTGLACAINSQDMIVGLGNDTFGPHQAVIFTPGQQEPYIGLGTLPRAASSEAFDVNDAGVIVGTSGDHPDWLSGHAIVITNRRIYDLNDLFIDRLDEWDVLIAAFAINNSGRIAGYGLTSDGDISAFLLTATDDIIGDFEPDGDVDSADFSIMAAAWSSNSGEPRWNPICDISDPADNSINLDDLAVFMAHWLETTN